MMMNYPRLAGRLFNQPLMMMPSAAEIAATFLQQQMRIMKVDRIDGTVIGASQMKALAGDARRSYGDEYKLFPISDSVAVIHIDGILVQKSGWIDPECGMTGYDGLTKKFRAAVNDGDVRAIWFDIDSPGGEVSGLFAFSEMVARYTDTQGAKPVWCYINEQACSAAYAIAAVCEKAYGPDGCQGASIGVCLMHMDYTGALEENGIKPTMFRSGERKARGGEYEALDEATITKWNEMINGTARRFASLVSMGRGPSVEDILALEGDWFQGQDLLDLKLIDGIVAEDECWNMLQREIARSR